MTDPANPGAANLPVILISGDLLFSSRITGTAADLGIRVDVEADPQRARERIAGRAYGCVILDLTLPGLSPAEVTASLPAEGRPRVVAFGPHVDTARLQAAREAGCDDVLPRSRFASTLADILRRGARGG